jgi:hypothetical protein
MMSCTQLRALAIPILSSERVWIARDGHRYTVRLWRGWLHFTRLDGRHVGAVAAEGRDLVSLDTEELEALLQDARGRE